MNNSEILYLYDAKLTNPNGDPDEENRPRMDYERETNLVSDLRLKRYVRDYLLGQGYEIFVKKIEENGVEKSATAKKRMKEFEGMDNEKILDSLIDVRLFGATMPIKENSKQFIGPVQFNWGYSLNKVEILEASITSHFASDENNEQGAMGKDYRVKYSFIAFSGVISAKRGEKTRLKDSDVDILDKALKYAIPEQITRSKVGQYPRLYLRVEYTDKETILGDLRDYIKLVEKEDGVRDISEVALEVSELREFLKENSHRISKIKYIYGKKLELLVNGEVKSFKEVFDGFSLEEV